MSQFDKAYIKQFFSAIGDNSDHRATAVICCSAIDDCLSEVIRARLVENAADFGDSKLDTKIKLAYAVGLISQSSRDRLNAIKEIRNAICHSVVIDTMDHDKFDHLFDRVSWEDLGPRYRFSRVDRYRITSTVECLELVTNLKSIERIAPRPKTRVHKVWAE